MKKLNMTIGMIFIIFAANCMEMDAVDQEDSPKAIENDIKPRKNMKFIEYNGLLNLDNFLL